MHQSQPAPATQEFINLAHLPTQARESIDKTKELLEQITGLGSSATNHLDQSTSGAITTSLANIEKVLPGLGLPINKISIHPDSIEKIKSNAAIFGAYENLSYALYALVQAEVALLKKLGLTEYVISPGGVANIKNLDAGAVCLSRKDRKIHVNTKANKYLKKAVQTMQHNSIVKIELLMRASNKVTVNVSDNFGSQCIFQVLYALQLIQAKHVDPDRKIQLSGAHANKLYNLFKDFTEIASNPDYWSSQMKNEHSGLVLPKDINIFNVGRESKDSKSEFSLPNDSACNEIVSDITRINYAAIKIEHEMKKLRKSLCFDNTIKSVYGSARFSDESKIFAACHQYSEEAVNNGKVILTGGGPSIMSAGINGGCNAVSGAELTYVPAIGLPLSNVPFEQKGSTEGKPAYRSKQALFSSRLYLLWNLHKEIDAEAGGYGTALEVSPFISGATLGLTENKIAQTKLTLIDRPEIFGAGSRKLWEALIKICLFKYRSDKEFNLEQVFERFIVQI